MGKFSPNFIGNYLNCIRKYNPSGEFMVYGDRRITWEELIERSYRLANSLLQIGIQKGDNVLFMFHNTPEFVEINLASQLIGAVPTPMNYRFVPREVAYQVNHSDAVIFFYHEMWENAVKAAAPELSKIKYFVCCGKKNMASAVDYELLLQNGEDADPEITTGRDDLAVMIYTGGTTGYPKGVMLTYGAHIDMYSHLFSDMLAGGFEPDVGKENFDRLVEGLPIPGTKLLYFITKRVVYEKIISFHKVSEYIRERMKSFLLKPERLKLGYRQRMKLMIPSMPFFHDDAYQALILSIITGNIKFIIPDKVGIDPEEIFKYVESERVVFMGNVPKAWKKITSSPSISKYNLNSIRCAINGGGAASISLKKKIFQTFPNTVVIDMFGQTEMAPFTTYRLDFSPDNLKERSVGKAIVDFKIVDDALTEMPQGEIGEILYKSSTIMKGYYKDEEKNQNAIVDGWFRSGDLGYVDEDGELRVVDRKKECIGSDGEKVFPMEVEDVILNHPDVADVCVIGVPDEDHGQSVRAVVVPIQGKKLTEKEIIDFCRGKIANYKICKSVVFTDELPHTPVGKILRSKIRDIYGKPDYHDTETV